MPNAQDFLTARTSVKLFIRWSEGRSVQHYAADTKASVSLGFWLFSFQFWLFSFQNANFITFAKIDGEITDWCSEDAPVGLRGA